MPRSINALCLSALLLALSACGESPTSPGEVRPVRTLIVDPKPLDDDRQAVGEIRPRQESDLGFRISGKLVSRVVDVGAMIKKGDLLARLDEGDYQNRLRSAEADVASAEAVQSEAHGAEARYRQLLSTGAATRANYDAALKNLRSAEAKLDAAKAALALARDQVKYTELTADFDGIVTAVGAEPGQVVNIGQMIVRLALPGEKDAVFAIAESAFRDRPPGDRPEIIVTLLSDPRVTTEGIVREISPVADPATRTFQVKVALKGAPEQMRFGSSVLGRLKAMTAPVVVLPSSALFDKGGRPAVWVYLAASSTVSLKPVVVARFETDRVVVSEGLAKGEVVVTAGVNRLREGQKVRAGAGSGP
ncbi:MAG TPA: efflux RND transporter periplasmic adaptor subunit [Hyphomicrobiaceae bacterium]|nr:efflux RND transporter periplasmic adaptor subunit [Hyphomicrobiaceae bacterium]